MRWTFSSSVRHLAPLPTPYRAHLRCLSSGGTELRETRQLGGLVIVTKLGITFSNWVSLREGGHEDLRPLFTYSSA